MSLGNEEEGEGEMGERRRDGDERPGNDDCQIVDETDLPGVQMNAAQHLRPLKNEKGTGPLTLVISRIGS